MEYTLFQDYHPEDYAPPGQKPSPFPFEWASAEGLTNFRGGQMGRFCGSPYTPVQRARSFGRAWSSGGVGLWTGGSSPSPSPLSPVLSSYDPIEPFLLYMCLETVQIESGQSPLPGVLPPPLRIGQDSFTSITAKEVLSWLCTFFFSFFSCKYQDLNSKTGRKKDIWNKTQDGVNYIPSRSDWAACTLIWG